MDKPLSNSSSYSVYFLNESCEVRDFFSTGQKSLHAAKAFSAGDVISSFGASFVSTKPSYLTVQVGHRKHIALLPQFLQYANHSCCPNCFFDTTAMQFVAIRDIRPGDELTFFYPSSEWDMAQPFECNCKQPNCLGLISGAAFIPEEVLKNYRLTDFIAAKLKSRLKKEKRA